MISRFDVVVIGGGMVGLTLACALGQGGKKVAIVEASEPQAFDASQEHDLRVVAVNRASQHVLENVGAWRGVLEMRAAAYQAMNVWDAGGAGNIGFTAADMGEVDLGHIVESRVIQLALLERAKQLDTVEWLCPVRVERFVADEKEAIVTLENGQLLMTPLVVGADGANSFVRDMAGIEIKRNDYHQSGLVATIKTSEHHENTAWQRFQPDGVLAFLPMDDGYCSIVWSSPTERADELMTMPEGEFRLQLAAAFEYRLGEIISCSERRAFPLRGGQAAQYVKHRIALVGDAAHTIHPLAGQGVNLGFMDAAQLAEVLLDTRRDLGSMSVLRKYERARVGDNLVMQRLMEGFKLLYGNASPTIKWIRNAGMSSMDGLGPLKHGVMSYALGTSGQKPKMARRSFT